MTFPWQKMTIEEFASFERRQGERIHQINGIYWRRVRPFFYRPLLPFQAYRPEAISPPSLFWFGGFQHAVPAGEKANSFLNMLLFEETEAYSLGDLHKQERRQIKRAAEDFTVSLVTDVNEFKVQAYRVYLSFYERTKYEYKSERRYESNFSKWADSVFQNPKVIVLGAYKKNRELGAIEICHLVEDTLVGSTFFCETESLKMHVTGFMLHTMREAIAGCQAIKQIFIGNYKYTAVNGVDDFYLTRGCKLVSKPALLHINPLAKVFLKCFMSRQYAKLTGNIESCIKPDEESNTSSKTLKARSTSAADAGAVDQFRASGETMPGLTVPCMPPQKE